MNHRDTRPAKGRIGILLIHAQPILGEALAGMIDRQPDLQVVECISSCTECRERVDSTHAEVVLCAINSQSFCRPLHPEVDPTRSLTPLREVSGTVPIIGLADDLSDWEVVALLQFGFSGLVSGESSSDSLYSALRTASRGDCYLDERAQQIVMRNAAGNEATRLATVVNNYNDREKSILALLAEGKTNEEIAESIHVSRATVKKSLTRLFSKLGVANRVALAALAVAMGSLID